MLCGGWQTGLFAGWVQIAGVLSRVPLLNQLGRMVRAFTLFRGYILAELVPRDQYRTVRALLAHGPPQCVKARPLGWLFRIERASLRSQDWSANANAFGLGGVQQQQDSKI